MGQVEQIKKKMRELGISEAQLAAAVDTARSTISRLLRKTHKKQPRISTLKKVAAALQIPLEQLLGARQLELDAAWDPSAGPAFERAMVEQFQAVPRHLKADAAREAVSAMVSVMLKSGKRPSPQLYSHLALIHRRAERMKNAGPHLRGAATRRQSPSRLA